VPTPLVGCLLEDGVAKEIVLGALRASGLRLAGLRIELDWESE
jgi:hypothetical protein